MPLPAGRYFKGGWGSGTGRVDNQVALLVKGDERVSVAVLTVATARTPPARRRSRIFARLLRGLTDEGARGAPSCDGCAARRRAGCYSASGGGTAGWSSAPCSSSPACGSSSSLPPPTGTGAGFGA